MKVYIAFIFSFLFIPIFSLKYEKLNLNKFYSFKSFDDSIQYYKISLREAEKIPSEIKIETKIMETKNKETATIAIYYEPFKTKNYNKIIKSHLGETISLDNEFIDSSMKRTQNIYFAIYCEKCLYNINIIPLNDKSISKNYLVQMPELRKLEETSLSQNNDTITRLYVYSANGISSLMVGFFMIFVSVIACIIMMNIYVHNTALVEQPLKLGRVEA